MPFLVRLVLLAVLIGIVAAAVPGIDVHGGFGWLLWIALLFAVINTVLGTLLRLVTLPLIVLTWGLFLLVINAALLGLTALLTEHLDVDSFGAALVGGLLIALGNAVVTALVPPAREA